MNIRIQYLLLILSTVLAGLLAGFFYTWSFTIMQSLSLIEEHNAASAMNSINSNIRTGWFAAIFFGAPVSIIFSLIVIFREKQKVMYLWVSLASLFALATFIVTFTVHLPLNSELENGAQWSSYVEPWVQWNHVRMGTSLAAFLCMLCVINIYGND